MPHFIWQEQYAEEQRDGIYTMTYIHNYMHELNIDMLDICRVVPLYQSERVEQEVMKYLNRYVGIGYVQY